MYFSFLRHDIWIQISQWCLTTCISSTCIFISQIFSFKSKEFFFPIPIASTILLRERESHSQENRFKRNSLIASARSKMFIYQWTLINRLPDDKALHEIAYLWCRLSSLSTSADPSRSSIGGSFLPSFPRPLLRPFPFPPFFIHPTGHASFGHVSFLPLTGQVLSRGSGDLERKRTANHSPTRKTVVTRIREGQNIRRGVFMESL